MYTIPFSVTVYGQGGHGARPNEAHNPIDCFVALNAALAGFRAEDAANPCTVTVTTVASGNAINVIPDSLRLEGALSYTDACDAARFRERLPLLVSSLCEQFFCTAETKM